MRRASGRLTTAGDAVGGRESHGAEHRAVPAEGQDYIAARGERRLRTARHFISQPRISERADELDIARRRPRPDPVERVAEVALGPEYEPNPSHPLT